MHTINNINNIPVHIPCNSRNTTVQTPQQVKFMNKKSLKIMYLNAQSLTKKIEDIEHIISKLTDDIHILAITETWYSNNISKKQIITNFNKISAFRPNRVGGGASIYVNKILSFRETFVWSNDDDSIVKVEIFDNRKICDVVCVYRTPSPVSQSFGDFIDKLDEVLNNCRPNTIIVGDMNVDLIKDDARTRSYLDTVHSNGFTVCNQGTITRPQSNTNIDHILTNNYTTPLDITQLEHYVSDHNIIFVELQHLQANLNKNITKIIKKINYEQLKTNLRTTHQIHHDETKTTDENYNIFEEKITISINTATSHKTINIKSRHLKPWTDTELQETIDATTYWYKKHSRDRSNDILKDEYKRWADKLLKMKFEKWRAYNATKLQQNLDNPRKIWSVIQTNIFEKEAQNENIIIQNGNTVTSEKPTVANKFNEYFTSVADSISSNLPDIPIMQLSPNIPPTEQRILYETNEEEVLKTINDLKTTKSVGHDNIPTELLKNCADLILTPLTQLINQSLTEGIFPNKLKIAKIIPIFKSGDRTSLSNYRPIALLPVISKVYEKIVRKRLVEYLDANNIIDHKQYGFRSKSNTETALFDLLSNIQTQTQRKRKVGLVFYDLQKAFDTVNIEILLTLLQNSGIHGNDLKWFASYLNDRLQYVEIGGVKSNQLRITSSVPQGSVLGPILFLLYVNNIQHLKLHGQPQLYADDIAILYNNQSFDEVKTNIKEDFVLLSKWTASMKLSINYEKSKILLIKNDLLIDQPISFNNVEIKFVNSYKYLGIDLDNRLNFVTYLNNLKKKLSQIAGLFRKLNHVVPHNFKKSLFNAFFDSHIQYGLNIWGQTFDYLVGALQRVQNKAIKNLFGYRFLERTNIIHEKTKILPIKFSLFLRSSCLIHNILHGYIHSNTIIRENRNFHEHNLRNNDNLRNESHNYTGFHLKPLLYSYISNYNKINTEIKNQNKTLFKRRLKIFIENGLYIDKKSKIEQIFP
jgi:hypothetical protein